MIPSNSKLKTHQFGKEAVALYIWGPSKVCRSITICESQEEGGVWTAKQEPMRLKITGGS